MKLRSFHSLEGEDGDSLAVALNDFGIGGCSILDYHNMTVERPNIAGLPTSGRTKEYHIVD